ncbi:MAG: hypothetical protein KDC80_20830 [Saprospiraceae bacterium]|nr:hypothetical protein [Saprospiraceae bacterium]
MKKLKLLILKATFLLSGINLPAQGLQEELLFSYDIESKIALGELRTTSASYYYTFIGDYSSAISLYDIPVSWGVDTLILSDLSQAPALAKILEIARDQQIVIISESHLKPQHRIFAKKLIDSLYDYGFRHLGIETLAVDSTQKNNLHDSLLRERKFPMSLVTGFYAREPQMADLIRTALHKGYQLFGYDREKKLPGKDRDEIQADNIIKYLNSSGNDKIILYGGWHHANESNDKKPGRNAFWMAKYLKDKTGIDPLTIYQDNFTEKMVTNTHPYLASRTFTEHSIFMDKDGTIASLSPQVDIEIIHPKTTYINGRPSWLRQHDFSREFYFEDIPADIDYPLLLMAFIPGEEKMGVPVDIFEMKDRYDRKPLLLVPGNYVIRIFNKAKTIDKAISLEP